MFVANCRRKESPAGQVTEFIPDLIVARDNKTTGLALKGMADRKFLSTAITMHREVTRGASISEEKTVSKFFCR